MFVPDWNNNSGYQQKSYDKNKKTFMALFEGPVLTTGFTFKDALEVVSNDDLTYLNKVTNDGANLDWIKTRAIIDNYELGFKHLQLDSNTLISNYKDLYKQTFGQAVHDNLVASNVDRLNASAYDEDGLYVSAHNKIVYTIPNGKIGPALAKEFSKHCKEISKEYKAILNKYEQNQKLVEELLKKTIPLREQHQKFIDKMKDEAEACKKQLEQFSGKSPSKAEILKKRYEELSKKLHDADAALKKYHERALKEKECEENRKLSEELLKKATALKESCKSLSINSKNEAEALKKKYDDLSKKSKVGTKDLIEKHEAFVKKSRDKIQALEEESNSIYKKYEKSKVLSKELQDEAIVLKKYYEESSRELPQELITIGETCINALINHTQCEKESERLLEKAKNLKSKNAIYNKVFCKGLEKGPELTTCHELVNQETGKKTVLYLANFSKPQYALTKNIITVPNMTWTEANISDPHKALKGIQPIKYTTQFNSEVYINFACFWTLIRIHTAPFVAHNNQEDVEKIFRDSLHDKEENIKIMRAFCTYIKEKHAHLFFQLVKVIPPDDNGKQLCQNIFGKQLQEMHTQAKKISDDAATRMAAAADAVADIKHAGEAPIATAVMPLGSTGAGSSFSAKAVADLNKLKEELEKFHIQNRVFKADIARHAGISGLNPNLKLTLGGHFAKLRSSPKAAIGGSGGIKTDIPVIASDQNLKLTLGGHFAKLGSSPAMTRISDRTQTDTSPHVDPPSTNHSAKRPFK